MGPTKYVDLVSDLMHQFLIENITRIKKKIIVLDEFNILFKNNTN